MYQNSNHGWDIAMYSSYYQAKIDKVRTWQVVATLRLHEHMLFDRTVDKEQNRFEFFVSPGEESLFLDIMQMLQKKGLVTDLAKLPNPFAK